MPKKIVQIYDTTLRDGTQSEEIAFTVEDKLRITEKLDWLGLHYIEGGWPGANPKDSEFFARASRELKLKNSRLVAFGSTRKSGRLAANDQNLRKLLAADTKTICIFGKSWDLHVKRALNISLRENLELISDSIDFLKKNKKEVIYDAEHFFDGYKRNRKYALDTLKAAIRGKVDRIILCDTNGGTLPEEVEKIIKGVRKIVMVPLGVHCHNDAGLAAANSLVAVRCGVTQVQGTINGIGERCGNANLSTIIANLELKMGYQVIGAKKLARLREVSLFVNEIANRAGSPHQPYVGRAAFAHKGGVHVHAILKDSRTYEHIDPAKVGNRQRILVSDLSGAATVVQKAKEYGVDLKADNKRVKELLAQLKSMENRGYEFEAAEASFEILIKKAIGLYKPHFVLHDFKVTDEITIEKAKPSSEAVIHIAVDGKEEMTVAKGVGPVHALDRALRKALERFYPQISEVRLLDYKVRVLPAPKPKGLPLGEGPLLGADEGTASSVRVLIECGDHDSKWGTVGVSENIIQASYQALVDSIDYKLMKDKA